MHKYTSWMSTFAASFHRRKTEKPEKDRKGSWKVTRIKHKQKNEAILPSSLLDIEPQMTYFLDSFFINAFHSQEKNNHLFSSVQIWVTIKRIISDPFH